MCNYDEYASAGKADKQVADIHDDRYGRYKDNVPEDDKKTVTPTDKPTPFTVGGKK